MRFTVQTLLYIKVAKVAMVPIAVFASVGLQAQQTVTTKSSAASKRAAQKPATTTATSKAPMDPDPHLLLNVVAWNASGARMPVRWAIDNKDSMCRENDIVDVSTDVAEPGQDASGMHPGSSSKSIVCPHGKFVCAWNGTISAGWEGPYAIPCQTKLIPNRFKADGKVNLVFNPVLHQDTIYITHNVTYPYLVGFPNLTHQDEAPLRCVGDRFQEPPNSPTDEMIQACISEAKPQ